MSDARTASAAEKRRADLVTFAVLLVSALVCTLLPLPWRLAGLVFAGWAGVLGVRSLGRLAASARDGGVPRAHLGVAVGLGAVVVMLVQLGSQAALLPAELERQDCLAGAGTGAARESCEKAFLERLPWAP